MKLTTNTNVSVDGVMQGLGGPEENRRGGFERGGWAMPYFDEETAAYWGTTATASISTKKSGCARPETNAIVMAGGLGVSGQAF